MLPWIDTTPLDQRRAFIAAWIIGDDTVANLARRFRISRKTAHKFINRFKLLGDVGLHDLPRAPRNARATAPHIAKMIVDAKKKNPISGPADLEAVDAALASLNVRFDPDDFHVVSNGGGLEVWLREIDLAVLRAAAAARLSGAGEAMRRIVEAVEGAGGYGINGGKRLYVGYNRERKVAGCKGKERRRGKHYYANDHAHERGENAMPPEFADRIVCGDSEEVLKRLPDNCIDLVFTSPPYNFGLGYEDGDGSADKDDAARRVRRMGSRSEGRGGARRRVRGAVRGASPRP